MRKSLFVRTLPMRRMPVILRGRRSMNAETQTDELPSWLPSAVWTVALLLPLLAISRQSFWIDEAITGNAARQSTVAGCWHSLQAINGSDLQMPLYMLYVFVWEKLFGASEFVLRLANYPFFVIAQIAGAHIWNDRRKGYLFILIASCSSFLWFYLDEARPYAIEYGLSCVIFSCLSSIARDSFSRPLQFWSFALALVALAGVNMLGVAWVGTGLLVAAYFLIKHRRMPAIAPVLFCGAGLGALGAYYGWTLSSGARAAVIPTNALLGAIFLAYELLGFVGLGPGRLDIRVNGFASFIPFLLPLLAFAVVIGLTLWRALRAELRTPARGRFLAATFYALLPVGFLLLLGMVTDFRVLGRHIIPTLPYVFALATVGLWSLWTSKTVWTRSVAASFFLLNLAACLGVRFLPRHDKDDYRGASAVAAFLVSQGQVVWWCASPNGAEFYGLPLRREGTGPTQSAVDVRNLTDEAARELIPPRAVILSKPDIFDGQGAITAMLEKKKFVLREKLPSFTIWEAPNETYGR